MTTTILLLRHSTKNSYSIFNENHLVQIFNIFDTDGNGIVDFREFMMATATAALILYLPSFKQMFISTDYILVEMYEGKAISNGPESDHFLSLSVAE